MKGNLIIMLIIAALLSSCTNNEEQKSFAQKIIKKELKRKDSIYILGEDLPYPGPPISVLTTIKRLNRDAYQDYPQKCELKIKTLRDPRDVGRGDPQSVQFKTIYSSKPADSLILGAIISAVKYYGDYYVIAFPSPRGGEWADFTPPKDADGYMLYRPIVFFLDTVKFQLTRLKYNEKMKLIPRKLSRTKPYHRNLPNIEFYHWNKYGLQFRWAFTFSKSKKEYVYGKEIYNYWRP